MVKLTGFADEISADLQTQLETLTSAEIRHLELRGVWNKNVLTLTDAELEIIRETLMSEQILVSAIASPIGKISIIDDFEPHLENFLRAIEIAKYFKTPYIRIFSFFIPPGDHPRAHREEVLLRMEELVRCAKAGNVILLHENEKHIYGDTPERCAEIFQACASAHLRMAFDPANFVQCGVKPMTEAYPLLEPYIEYFHIKDALFANGQVVPAGLGDGEIKSLLKVLKSKNYQGFLSLEPHLKSANAFAGFSGPDLFGVATNALKSLLLEESIGWEK